MDLRVVAGSPNCRGGSCPTIYEAPNGDLVIQGYSLAESERDSLTVDGQAVSVPPGEDVVVVPRELIAKLTSTGLGSLAASR